MATETTPARLARSIQTALLAETADRRAAGVEVLGFECSISYAYGAPCQVIMGEGQGAKSQIEAIADFYRDVVPGAVRIATDSDDDFEGGLLTVLHLDLDACQSALAA